MSILLNRNSADAVSKKFLITARCRGVQPYYKNNKNMQLFDTRKQANFNTLKGYQPFLISRRFLLLA